MIKKILLSFLTLNLIFFSSLTPQQKAEASSVNFLERELNPDTYLKSPIQKYQKIKKHLLIQKQIKKETLPEKKLSDLLVT